MDTKNKHYDVIVIGGGASGIMAAISAAENNASVLIIEKNKRLGEKLRITGGGRCNITNAELDMRVLLKNYGKAEKFLYSAFTTFGVSETINFFESIKLPIKIEDRKRAFPASEKAADVVHVLQNRLHRLGVELATNSPVTDIIINNNAIEYLVCGDALYTAKNYILATGGTSRPETGSTGDGFNWLAKFGHTTKSPTPTITPIAVKESWVEGLAGLTAENVGIAFYNNKVKAFSLKGTILFTHFGLSGPLILNNAYKVADALQNGEVIANIDMFPDLNHKQLDQYIINLLNENGSKLFKNSLGLFVPRGIATVITLLLHTSINFESKNSELPKESRFLLVNTLKALPLTIDRLMGFEKAVVADGGVALNEIDMRTMRSQKIQNLFVTGDLLDINRPSGGYSLQLSWTTGYIAGTNAASS